ncbi:hypothetical protein [Pontivivens insulae]|uniref:Uncharacterized protein n=1 Tax=Pontivivens insulae TaxID=1639689 RepID=A0A2R8A8E3_9RHOB|nr:hypothetical protein [Pontivivens insulae]RED18598.1 hypothetical protein DFR53_0796 [Pontivivens insulae]SPF28496.1 hypothetical protein POI8812_00797 [Pontivivens insulae]
MTSEAVWWFEGFWEEDHCRAPVAAYADTGQDPVQVIGRLSKELRQREIKFGRKAGPDCLFVSDPNRRSDREFDDLGPMTMRGILISGAMIDLFTDFELGASQVLELPMYEGLGKQLSSPSGLKQPDLTRPVPGRWGLLHVRERKNSLIDDRCSGVSFRIRKAWMENPPLMAEVPYRNSQTVIGLDATKANAGPDLWFEERIDDVPFISDCLRRAILDAGLRVPTMKWLKQARLY